MLVCEVIATWFYCGRAPFAPGTVGSAAALLFFPLAISNALFGFILLCALFLVGILSVDGYLKHRPGVSDPKEVVVDEICGQLFVFVIIAACVKTGVVAISQNCGPYDSLRLLLSGFISFRVFDIAKPWPICVIDKSVKGALGVMLDDIAAALPAAVVTLAVESTRWCLY
ncbi:phosphatidylglycerophosphatase A [Candidatus Anaplasma sp. TIGMIC]|uniref:phosphatidylglycerophosphatase A family protein n=1 Tax=Candidatus Anaplasma sp. TIGMIC TaxID=3020713 RepID=UPI00232D5CB5|nr:phosphatidylglycerophosphatase A [Candidatus Anaplasma sp. TIGMIC]